MPQELRRAFENSTLGKKMFGQLRCWAQVSHASAVIVKPKTLAKKDELIKCDVNEWLEHTVKSVAVEVEAKAVPPHREVMMNCRGCQFAMRASKAHKEAVLRMYCAQRRVSTRSGCAHWPSRTTWWTRPCCNGRGRAMKSSTTLGAL